MVQVETLESYSTSGKVSAGNNSISSSRREIANSNERKRMIAINEGFSTLKDIVPGCAGDKQSKSKILRLAASYINSLLAKIALLEAKNGPLDGSILEATTLDRKSSLNSKTNLDDSGTDSNISSPKAQAMVSRVPNSGKPKASESDRATGQDKAPRRPRSHTDSSNNGKNFNHFEHRSQSVVSTQSQGRIYPQPPQQTSRQNTFLPAKDLEQSIQELQDRLEEMKGSLVAHSTPVYPPEATPVYTSDTRAHTQASQPAQMSDRMHSTELSQMPPSHPHPRKELEHSSPRWQPYLPRRVSNKGSPNWSPNRGSTTELSNLTPLPPTTLPSGQVTEYHGKQSQLSNLHHQYSSHPYARSESSDDGIGQQFSSASDEPTTRTYETTRHSRRPSVPVSKTQPTEGQGANRVFSMLSSHPFSTSRDSSDWHEQSRTGRYSQTLSRGISSSSDSQFSCSQQNSWTRMDNAPPSSNAGTAATMTNSEQPQVEAADPGRSRINHSQDMIIDQSQDTIRTSDRRPQNNHMQTNVNAEVPSQGEQKMHRPGGSLDTLCEAIYRIDGAIADPAGA